MAPPPRNPVLIIVRRLVNFPDEVIMSRRGRMGRILSPRHTLPPNTTCTYYFHGYQPSDRVWIYFTNYHLQILQPTTGSSTASSSTANDGNAINNTYQNYFAGQVRKGEARQPRLPYSLRVMDRTRERRSVDPFKVQP